MISVAEALERITGAFAPLALETVALSDALGRALGEDVVARMTQPPVAVSAMDGYAVRAEDTAAPPVTLRVVGEAPAGGAYDGRLGAGEAVRIFTGGPVPDGADAIVILAEELQIHDEPLDEKVVRSCAIGERRVIPHAESDARVRAHHVNVDAYAGDQAYHQEDQHDLLEHRDLGPQPFRIYGVKIIGRFPKWGVLGGSILRGSDLVGGILGGCHMVGL